MPRTMTKPDAPAESLADLHQFTLAEVVEHTKMSRSAIIEKLRDPASGLKFQRFGKSKTYAKYMFTRAQVEAIVASFTNEAAPAEVKREAVSSGKRRVGKRY